MCFGNMQQSGQQNTQQNTTQTTTPASWLTAAGQGNIDYLNTLPSTFTPYGGQFVAPLSAEQLQSISGQSGIAAGANPYAQQAGSMLYGAANAPRTSVNTSPIWANMSPYMSQYVQQALMPQIQAQNQQFAQQNRGFDASATGAGAFGDTGWGLGRSNLTTNQDIARAGLLGNAYNAAFNTAIGAGQQDVANRLAASGQNANLYETALQRQMAGANQLYGMGSGANQVLNQLAAQQQQTQQAQLNAMYNQWLMGQQYPGQYLGWRNQAIGGAAPTAPTTTTGTSTGQTQTYAPNNMGYALLGAGIGAAGTALGGPFGGMLGASMFGGGGGYGGGMPMNLNPMGTFGMPGSQGAMYARGGQAPPGQPAIVGERGPEMIVPPQGGTVIPNHEIQRLVEKYRKRKPQGRGYQEGGYMPQPDWSTNTVPPGGAPVSPQDQQLIDDLMRQWRGGQQSIPGNSGGMIQAPYGGGSYYSRPPSEDRPFEHTGDFPYRPERSNTASQIARGINALNRTVGLPPNRGAIGVQQIEDMLRAEDIQNIVRGKQPSVAGIPQFQYGGEMEKRGGFVGEAGPELFVPNTSPSGQSAPSPDSPNTLAGDQSVRTGGAYSNPANALNLGQTPASRQPNPAGDYPPSVPPGLMGSAMQPDLRRRSQSPNEFQQQFSQMLTGGAAGQRPQVFLRPAQPPPPRPAMEQAWAQSMPMGGMPTMGGTGTGKPSWLSSYLSGRTPNLSLNPPGGLGGQLGAS